MYHPWSEVKGYHLYLHWYCFLLFDGEAEDEKNLEAMLLLLLSHFNRVGLCATP